MAITCLVLGAGASLANALHFRSERSTASNPPLDYTFFDKVQALGIAVPPELKAYAANNPGADPFRRRAGQPAVRMEEFFKELFSDFQEAGRGTRVAKAYEQVVDIYVRVLRETTDWIGSDNRTGGPIGRLLAAEAKEADEVFVLTFNHDLVIENEIAKRAALRRRWCLEQGYGTVSGQLQFTTSTGNVFPGHTHECAHSSGLHILKLHGSLNWYVRMRGRSPSRSVLSGGGSTQTIFCSRRRAVPHQLRFVNRTGSGRSSWYTWPVVVPPVHGKDALIRNLVPDVWADADAALGACNRLVFVGYSLPMLDVQSERLFRRSIAGNANLDWVDIVNPAPDTAHRFAQLGQPTPLRWYASIERYLERQHT